MSQHDEWSAKVAPLKAFEPPVLKGGDVGSRARLLESLRSPQFRSILARIKEVSENRQLPLLFVTEAGLESEWLAKFVHERSGLSGKPFVALNCAAIERKRLAAELFGTEQQSFHFALENRRGFLELTPQGTMFLDQIDEISSEVQERLARLIRTGKFCRAGGVEEFSSAVRIVGCSEYQLGTLCVLGKFSRDFYYALGVVEIRIPPLRERPEDVRTYAAFFCDEAFAARRRRGFLEPEVLDFLATRTWPGNLPQLMNLIQRLVLLHPGGCVRMQDLEPLGALERIGQISPHWSPKGGTNLRIVPEATGMSLAEIEARHIARVLRLCEGNRTHAARLLMISRSTLLRKIEQYGLEKAGTEGT